MSELILPRRKLLKGLIALAAAPAIVRASSLMPVKVMRPTFPVALRVPDVYTEIILPEEGWSVFYQFHYAPRRGVNPVDQVRVIT